MQYIRVWAVLFSLVEPVGQMSLGFKSLIVMFVRYLKTQRDMVLFSMFRHHCCSQNILDKRNSSTSGAGRCLGAVVWRLWWCYSLSLCMWMCMRVCIHVPATVSVYMFVCMLMRKGVVLLSYLPVHMCMHTIVIKARSKRASYCPHNEQLETGCNVK